MGEILDRARDLRKQTLSHLQQTTTAASKLWADLHISMHQRAIDEIHDDDAFTAFLTENNAFTFPRLTSDPECPAVARRLLDYLDRNGMPLSGFAPSIEESQHAGAGVVWLENGRRVSAAFLFQLCKALRISAHAPNVETVLEVGAGYGGLARTLQLMKPRRRYIIVDLVDSLFCSYTFLAANFPNARMLWVTKPDAAADLAKYDFVFVPAHLVDVLQGEQVDLAVNTASLGEMTQDAVNRYMALIHDGARYFYSHNRYGRRDPLCSPDQCRSAIVLDSGWDVLLWDLWGKTGFGQAEPATPPSLEILVRRRPLPADAQLLAAAYYQLATLAEVNSSLWHFCMWNSIRMLPAKANLTAYLRVIESSGDFNEAAFFRTKLAAAQDISLSLPAGLDTIDGLCPQLPVARTEPPLAAELVAVRIENAPLATELAAVRTENARLAAELAAVLRSKSWRITAPLRALISALK